MIGDDEQPCDDCNEFISGLMGKRWLTLNASLAMSTMRQIEALARAMLPDDADEAEVKVRMLRSVEAIAIAAIVEVCREHEDAAALDAFHGHLVRDVLDYRLQQKERDDAKRQRKAAPGNGGGSAWTQ